MAWFTFDNVCLTGHKLAREHSLVITEERNTKNQVASTYRQTSNLGPSTQFSICNTLNCRCVCSCRCASLNNQLWHNRMPQFMLLGPPAPAERWAEIKAYYIIIFRLLKVFKHEIIHLFSSQECHLFKHHTFIVHHEIK